MWKIDPAAIHVHTYRRPDDIMGSLLSLEPLPIEETREKKPSFVLHKESAVDSGQGSNIEQCEPAEVSKTHEENEFDDIPRAIIIEPNADASSDTQHMPLTELRGCRSQLLSSGCLQYDNRKVRNKMSEIC